MSTQRSVIHSHKRARQVMAFNDMIRMRNISPTDLDAMYDYNGRAFLYMEGKFKGKKMDRGQRLALEHICKSHWRAQDAAAVILFSHETPSDMDVMVGYQFIEMIYSRIQIPGLCGRRYQDPERGADYWWYPIADHMKVLEGVDLFEKTFKCIGL